MHGFIHSWPIWKIIFERAFRHRRPCARAGPGSKKFRGFIYQRSWIDGNDENRLSATVMGKYRSLGLPTTQAPPVSRTKPVVMAAGRMAT